MDEATSWTTSSTSSKERKDQEGKEAESIAEKIRKVNEEIQRKANEAKEKENGFAYPRDFSSEWKFYTENGSIWRQRYVTQEKIWCDYDYAYKREKGTGNGKNKNKKGHGGEGKEGREELKEKLRRTLEGKAQEEGSSPGSSSREGSSSKEGARGSSPLAYGGKREGQGKDCKAREGTQPKRKRCRISNRGGQPSKGKEGA